MNRQNSTSPYGGRFCTGNTGGKGNRRTIPLPFYPMKPPGPAARTARSPNLQEFPSMRNLLVALCALVSAAPLAAQSAAPTAADSSARPAALSIDDALALAKRNNPLLQQTRNNLR